MSVALAEKPCILHTIPGRLRVHLPGWGGQGKRNIETRLRQVEGVQNVQANALTGNVLIQFDPAVTNEQSILAVVNALVTIEPVPLKTNHPLHQQSVKSKDRPYAHALLCAA